MQSRLIRALGASLALVAMLVVAAGAEGVADFYKGRNLSLVIGYSVGGGYDA